VECGDAAVSIPRDFLDIVIPGHREAVSPESILKIVVMDSGLALWTPRNDERRKRMLSADIQFNLSNSQARARLFAARCARVIRQLWPS
jgi:hypothetical protein